MMEYSAGLTSQLFWLQEARKTASLMEEGKEKVNIREIVWTENIYQVRAEYRAIEVLNNTWRRISLLPKNVRKLFVNCDIETAKVINLISIMMDSRILFEFMHDVFSEKIRLGEKEITDRDLNVFFDKSRIVIRRFLTFIDTSHVGFKSYLSIPVVCPITGSP